MVDYSYDCEFFLKRNKDKKKGIRDAWTYGASIVVIYVTLGLAITLIFGASALNALSTNAVFNILFFPMLVVLQLLSSGHLNLLCLLNGVMLWTAKRKRRVVY